MNIRVTAFLCLLLVFCVSCGDVEKHEQSLNNRILERLEVMLDYPVDSTAFPRSLNADGTVKKVPSRDWTCGFFPGSLLYAYALTQDHRFLDKANDWLPFIEKEKYNGGTHDMGFKVYSSYGNAYKIEPKEDYKAILLRSAETLSGRFNTNVGCIKSWDFGADRWEFPVIIDNMINLELLFKATQLSGDSTFYYMAVSHAEKTMKNHYRSDYSCYHVVDYDPQTGQVRQKLTHQGYAVESSWARGQAWGLYGFTMAYRYTKNKSFLSQAENIATYLMNTANMPNDKIPYWDFDDPTIPNTPKDASAAAVMASALVELYGFTGESSYLQYAKDIVKTLSSDQYILKKENKSPFILTHSTGNKPKNDEVDVPIAYADYYFLETIKRLNETATIE